MNFTPTGMIYIKVVVITLQIIMYDEKFMEELNFDVRSVLSTFYAWLLETNSFALCRQCHNLWRPYSS